MLAQLSASSAPWECGAMRRPTKIIILGAGISGLSAAWFLKKKYGDAADITLIDKSARAGGCIRTLHNEGFLFEEGPRGFRPAGKGQVTLQLIQELGLQNELIASSKKARKRYISLNGKLKPFNLFFLLREHILSATLRDLLTPAQFNEDETIASFTARRFNNRLVEHLMDPLTKGIFGGSCETLSMRSCFPLIWNYEKDYGSVIKGFLSAKKEKHPVSLYTLKRGMQSLTEALVKQLNCHFLFSHEVHSIEELEAHIIISALPLFSLCALLKLDDPFEYTSIATVNCGWRKDILKKRGYGFLVPTKERGDILGMTWDSELFPQHNLHAQTRLCVMLDGNLAHEEILIRAINSLKTYLNIQMAPDSLSLHIAKNAIPQYSLYHHQRLNELKKQLPPNLYMIGNGIDGVGVNDCIFNAKKLVDNIRFSP